MSPRSSPISVLPVIAVAALALALLLVTATAEGYFAHAVAIATGLLVAGLAVIVIRSARASAALRRENDTRIAEAKKDRDRWERRVRRLENILETSPIGILLSDLEGQITWSNPKTAAVAGTTTDALVGRATKTFYRDIDDARAIAQDLADSGSVLDRRVGFRRVDGEDLWIQLSVLMLDDEGDPGTIAWVHDVTRDVQVADEIEGAQAALAAREAELGRSNAVLRSVLDNMGHGVVVYDPRDRLVVHNRRFAEMYHLDSASLAPGTPRTTVAGLVGRTNWPDRREDAVDTLLLHGVEEGEAQVVELPDSSIYQRAVFRMPEGGAVVTHTDVTERMRAETDLDKQREVLQDVFDNVAQGLAAYDADARVITWNKKYQEFLVLSDEQIRPGLHVWDLVMLHAQRGTYGDGDLEALKERTQARIDQLMSGEITRFDYVNAEGVPMEAVSAPRPQGGFVVTYADIRERKKAEADIIRARDEAEAANRAKSSFLAAMSHEIRTPMNGVLGLIEVLENGDLSQDQRTLTATIHDSAMTLLRILDDILDFSKIEAGRLELEATPVGVRRTVELVLDTVGAEAEAKGLDLTCIIAPDVPERVIGDPVRLRQILLNLVGNGVKFTDQGSVVVEVSARSGPEKSGPDILGPETMDRCHLTCRVTDTGLGITEANQAKLFRPFSQAEETTTRRFGGTGLGLSISHRLVEMMGGTIGVDSTIGAGSTFWFTLPMDVAPATTEASTAPADSPAPTTVMLLSDRPHLTAMIDHDLSALGLDVRTFADPEDVRAAIAGIGVDDPPVVLVIDDRVRAPDAVDLATWAATHRASMEPELGAEARFGLLLVRGTGSSQFQAETGAAVSTSVTRPIRRDALLNAIDAALSRGSTLSTEATSARSTALAARPVSTSDALAAGQLILVAEDNATNRLLVERQLSMLGYAADYAEDGRQALGMWRDKHYALLLTDCHMPTMDGFDLTRAIRAAEEGTGRRMPIVALTANAMVGEADRCLAAGMDDYLAKPVGYKTLGRSLARWIGEAVAAQPTVTPDAGNAKRGTAPPAVLPILPVDRVDLADRIGADAPHAVSALIADFRPRIDDILRELEAARTAEDAGRLSEVATLAAGIANDVSATFLARTMHALANAAAAGNWSSIRRIWPRIEAQVDAVSNDLARIARGGSDDDRLAGE